jgi:phage shock protein A
MALITRFARLFRADVHAILDRIEEPDTLLRQSVREMEEQISQDQRRLTLMEHEQQQLATRQSDLEHSLSHIEEQLDVCFAANNGDLARAQIKRKLEALHLHKLVSRNRATLERSLLQHKTRLEENRVRCQAMRQKAELLAEQTLCADGAPTRSEGIDYSVGRDEVEIAFLREQQKRTKS